MRRSHPEEESTIDISPLIDMVFILLIFFMVSTTFVKDMEIDISRPGAKSSKAANTKSLRIFIDASEQLYVDGALVRPWVLQGKVREMVKMQGMSSVLVVADKKVSADKLIEVVDQCRMAGVKDVGVATKQEVGA
ncbi:MAG: biopolymer transporter ExbD [Bdellovibrionales bacterium]|nr:biopolymer transporter ExbD [Bdellovibrionales bacterium]